MKGTNRTSKNINRRKAALRNKLILVMVAFSIAISVGMFAGSNFADAHDNNAQMESIEYKCYKSIELKSGDTLWGIAETYMDDSYESIEDYIDELKAINNLDSDDIHEGRYLMVAYSN